MELDEVIKEFLVESYENLDELDRSLVQLESNPDDRGKLAAIFRTVHTIKGTCGFLGLGRLEKVTHVGENLLSKLRDGEIRLQPDITTGLLSLVDAIRHMLSNVESTGSEGEDDYFDLQQTLIELQSLSKEAKSVAAGNSAPAAPPTDISVNNPSSNPTSNSRFNSSTQASPSPTELEAPSEPGEETESEAEPTPTAEAPTRSSLPQATPAAPPAKPEKIAKKSTDEPGQSSAQQSGVSESNIRVDVALLEKLMTRVGELVLARNQIMQLNSGKTDSALQNAMQRLNLITSELQEGVMKTRMQPIGNVWSKFPRVVRDLASMCGKEVRIEMEGKETELDKTIIEAIKDPLTHLIRNTVDHGIERPEVRREHNKPSEGLLKLRAFHESGQVNIEIADDGAGLNLDRIRSKAIEKGLISQDQASKLHDRDVANLIFLP